MSGKKVTLGLVQMGMSEGVEDNLRHAIEMMQEAAEDGAEIVCLPELFTTSYFAQYERKDDVPEEAIQEIPGKVTNSLSKAAKRNKIMIVGGSLYERSDGKLFNTSTVFDRDGNMLGRYRKAHIPHDEKYFEQDYFEKGDTGFQVFPTTLGKVGVLICYDQWFPEAARIEALMGADMIFYPTAIGRVQGIAQEEGVWMEAWMAVMRGHAIANGTVVAAVNRVGIEDEMEFWGHSFVANAFGKILAMGGEEEEIVKAEIDLSHGKQIKEGWGFFRNRRPEAYSTIVGKAERG